MIYARDTNNYIEIEMPVFGIWMTPNTPGSKVPSHGTMAFGEAYAIDFVMLSNTKPIRKPYQSNPAKYILLGIPLVDFYGWGQTVHSPISGKVLLVENNVAERKRVNPFTDLQYMHKATREYFSTRVEPEKVAGNYVLIEMGKGKYALLAHLVEGSIVVRPGESVSVGQEIGKLGHSGNSMMPHLHLQFMDSADFRSAKGIPFIIKEYEVLKNGRWEKVINSIPTNKDIIRAL